MESLGEPDPREPRRIKVSRKGQTALSRHQDHVANGLWYESLERRLSRLPKPKEVTERDLLERGYEFLPSATPLEPPPPPPSSLSPSASLPSLREPDVDEALLQYQEDLVERYNQSLFREFALADLEGGRRSGGLGLRWRTREEVMSGKGATQCGAIDCNARDRLVVMEVNFRYEEHGEIKQALVKLTLCADCFHRMKKIRSKAARSSLDAPEKKDKKKKDKKKKKHRSRSKSPKRHKHKDH